MKKLATIVLACAVAALVSGCKEEQYQNQNTDTPVLAAPLHPWPPSEAFKKAQPQSVQDPYQTNVVLVLDTSGSMDYGCGGMHKLAATKKAALAFLDRIPPEASVALVTFGGHAEVRAPFGTPRQEIARQIKNLSAGGGTPMAEALQKAKALLEARAVAQGGGYGSYHIVLLGDGEPDREWRTIQTIDSLVAQTPITVATVGLCANLEVLARPGVEYREVQDASQLTEVFATLLPESGQYQGVADLDF